MPRLVVVAGMLALMVTGGLLGWPHLRGWWFFQRTPGRILDVLSQPADDGQVRLSIAYEYELPHHAGDHVRIMQIGWQIGDATFRPIADPQVPAAGADQAVRQLLDAGLPDRRLRTVFFRANDPAGTAFILDETATATTNRLQIGLVLIGLALIGGLYAWRRSEP